MPAIASLEELKMGRRDFRSMFLVVTPNALRFTVKEMLYALPARRSLLTFVALA